MSRALPPRLVVGGGRPLDEPTREFFEPRFGVSLESVRIHDDREARRAATALDADAFTVGTDVVLGRAADRRVLAHELAHVVQGGPLAIYRQAAEAEATEVIPVPGGIIEPKIQSPDPEGAGATQSSSTTLVGLAVPVHPKAISGIHKWSSAYGAMSSANSTNTFDVGAYVMVQVSIFDEHGNAQVYVYYTYNRDDKDDRWAVGPDIFMYFAMMYGGGQIKARAHNTDTPGKGPETIDPRTLPTAPDAFREEPQIFFMAPKLPRYDVKSDKFRIGPYYIGQGYLRRLPNGKLAVLYYVAENQAPQEIGRNPPPTLHRREWVIGPDSLKTFAEHELQMLNIAWAAYPREGEPSAYVMHSARYVTGVMHGDPDRAHEGWDAWTSAFKDPGWWSEVIFNYFSAGVPEPEVTPKPPPDSTPKPKFGPPTLVPKPKPDVVTVPTPKQSTSTLPNPKPSVSTSAPYIPSARGGAAGAPKLVPVPEIPPLPEVAPPLPAKPPLKSIPLQDPVPTPIGPVAPIAPRSNPPPAWIVGTINSILSGINLMPGVAPQPQQNPQQNQKPKRPVTLVLPPEKAALASVYRAHLGRLQHRVGRERDTAQQARWDAEMDPRFGGDMTLENFCRGRSMEAHRPLPYSGNLSTRDVLRPRWSPSRFWPDMQVDHRIEMQVTPIGGEEAYDQNWNYELLDRRSNTSSGSRLRSNIVRERTQLEQHYSDPTWQTKDITFERISVESAADAGRWSYSQVRDAEHLEAYKTLTGEPEPDPDVVGVCEGGGG